MLRRSSSHDPTGSEAFLLTRLAYLASSLRPTAPTAAISYYMLARDRKKTSLQVRKTPEMGPLFGHF